MRDLHRRALDLAAQLRALGIGRGDMVAIQLPNRANSCSAIWPPAMPARSLQTLHMPYRGAEIESLLAHSGAKAIVCLGQGKDFSPAEAILRDEAAAAGAAACHRARTAACRRARCHSMSHASRAGRRRPPRVADDDFVLLYTSGTVSAPKGVPIAYRKFLANARLSAAELEIGPSSILLTAAPLSHLYGLFAVNLAFAAGATMALLPAFTPPALADALDALQADRSFSPRPHT